MFPAARYGITANSAVFGIVSRQLLLLMVYLGQIHPAVEIQYELHSADVFVN